MTTLVWGKPDGDGPVGGVEIIDEDPVIRDGLGLSLLFEELADCIVTAGMGRTHHENIDAVSPNARAKGKGVKGAILTHGLEKRRKLDGRAKAQSARIATLTKRRRWKGLVAIRWHGWSFSPSVVSSRAGRFALPPTHHAPATKRS